MIQENIIPHLLELLIKADTVQKKNLVDASERIHFSLFFNFIKLKLFAKRRKAKLCLNDFLRNCENPYLQGKLEVWMEISLDENRDLHLDLQKKLSTLEAILQKKEDKTAVINEKSSKKENPEKLIVQTKQADNEQIAENEKIERRSKKAEKPKPTKQEEKSEPQAEEVQAKQLEPKNEEAENNSKPILVVWEFSIAAKYALEHALKFSKHLGKKIVLLHGVSHKSKIIAARKKMDNLSEYTASKFGVQIELIIEVGNVYSIVKEFAEKIEARLVFVGLHGKGNFDMVSKMGISSIIVQTPPRNNELKNILFPVDYRREVKQKLSEAKYLSEHFELKYHICQPEQLDLKSIQTKTKRNLHFMKVFFFRYHIDYDIHTIKKTSDFADATIQYAKQNKPDMIILLVKNTLSLSGYTLSAKEQKIIMQNPRIPIMCVNPQLGKLKGLSSGILY